MYAHHHSEIISTSFSSPSVDPEMYLVRWDHTAHNLYVTVFT